MRTILLFVLVLLSSFPARADQTVLNQMNLGVAVTNSDTKVYSPPFKVLYNGNTSACNIAVMFPGATVAVVFNNVQIGEFLPVMASQVMNTNTTCSNIVGGY